MGHRSRLGCEPFLKITKMVFWPITPKMLDLGIVANLLSRNSSELMELDSTIAKTAKMELYLAV